MTIEIDNNFDQFIDDMIFYASRQGKALTLNNKKATWLNFTNEAEEFDATNIPELGAPFSRNIKNGINQTYTEIIKTGGTHADIMALNLQAEYLAAMERAYRFRHAGKVRRQAWAAARFTGHGKEYLYDDASGVFDRIRNQVYVTIDAGGTDNYYTNPAEDIYLQYLDEIAEMQNNAMDRIEDSEDLLEEEPEIIYISGEDGEEDSVEGSGGDFGITGGIV